MQPKKNAKRIPLTNRTNMIVRDAVGAIENDNWDAWDRIKWELSDNEYQDFLDTYDLPL